MNMIIIYYAVWFMNLRTKNVFVAYYTIICCWFYVKTYNCSSDAIYFSENFSQRYTFPLMSIGVIYYDNAYYTIINGVDLQTSVARDNYVCNNRQG